MNLLSLVIELTNEDKELTEVELENLLLKVSNKIDAYISVDDFSDSQIEMHKKQIEFHKSKIQKYENLKSNLRSLALKAMQTLNVKKLSSDNGHSISCYESISTKILNVSDLPAWAVEIKTEIVPRKTIIKEHLVNNEVVPGAALDKKISVRFT